MAKEVKQLLPITIKGEDDKTIELWFTREIVLKMEDEDGVTPDVLADGFSQKQMNMSVMLTYYSMLAKQPDATIDEAKEILFNVGANKLVEALAERYQYTYDTMLEGEGKNAKWTMVR